MCLFLSQLAYLEGRRSSVDYARFPVERGVRPRGKGSVTPYTKHPHVAAQSNLLDDNPSQCGVSQTASEIFPGTFHHRAGGIIRCWSNN